MFVQRTARQAAPTATIRTRGLAANPIVWLVLVGAAFALLGCSARTDCKALRKRCDACEKQVFNALEPGVNGPKGWRKRKTGQWFEYCSRIKGRFKEAQKINSCLDAKGDCKEFARCFCNAVKKKGCAEPAAAKKPPTSG